MINATNRIMHFLTIFFWMLTLIAANPTVGHISQSTKPLHALVITGGHEFEQADFFAMFDSFENLTYEKLEQPQADEIYASPKVNDFDVLIFYDMARQISNEQKHAFLALLQQGKGMVFLHHSLVSYPDWDEFRKIIGGRYHEQPFQINDHSYPASTYRHDVDINVMIVNKNHPVTKGIEDFKIHDEVYGGYEILPTVHPLLKTDHAESTPIIGWANHYGNSHIVYLQSGHDHFAYENTHYRQLLWQAMQWVSEKY